MKKNKRQSKDTSVLNTAQGGLPANNTHGLIEKFKFACSALERREPQPKSPCQCQLRWGHCWKPAKAETEPENSPLLIAEEHRMSLRFRARGLF